MRLRARLALALAAASLPAAGGVALLQGVLERRAGEEALRQFALARMENGGREACEAWPETFPARPPRPPRGRGPGGPPRGEILPFGPEAGDPPPPPPGPDGGPPGRPGEEPDPAPEGGKGPPPPPPPPGALSDPLAPPRIEYFCYDAALASRNPKAPAFPAALRAALETGARHAADRFEDGEVRGSRVAVRMAWDEGPAAVVLAWRPDPTGGRAGLAAWGPLLACTGLLLAAFAAAGPVVRRVRALTVDVQRAAADRYATPVGVSGGDEIADLARAFNEAGAAARSHMEETERREKALREFVANTTHDVMVPLTVLQGHLDALRRGLDAGSPPERDKVLGAVEETQYMASLVHNLGAAARLESGGPGTELRPVDLGRVVERAVERHRPVASPLGISVEFAIPEEPVTVSGDDLLLEQAVGNLVHNAVRYNRSGGHVAVVLEAPKGGTEFSLRVADDGPGVPDDLLARLGERGLRADAARTRRPEGQGLGLFIVRGACDRHGFSVAFRRAEGGGLEVEMRGPRVKT